MKNRAVAATLVAALMLSGPVFAQSVEESTSRVLFEEGRKLMDAGQYAAACAKFEEGQRLAGGIGMKFNLGECYEKVGRIASAWSAFKDVAGLARAQGQETREEIALERAAALEPRLSRLTLEVPPSLRAIGVVVKRDGVVIGPAAWSVALPADPGTRSVTFEAEGYEPATKTIDITEGKNFSLVGPTSLVKKPDPPKAVVVGPTETVRDGKTQRLIGYVAGGAGIVGLGVGGAFGLMAMSKQSDSEPFCNGDQCNAEGTLLRDRAVGRATVSTVASITGLALLVGGVVLVLTAPKGKPADERKPAVRGGASFLVTGSGLGVQF